MKWVQNCRGKYCTHIYKCMLNEKNTYNLAYEHLAYNSAYEAIL